MTQKFTGVETSEVNTLRPLARSPLYNYPYNEDIK
jgi:hypothetical protein